MAQDDLGGYEGRNEVERLQAEALEKNDGVSVDLPWGGELSDLEVGWPFGGVASFVVFEV